MLKSCYDYFSDCNREGGSNTLNFKVPGANIVYNHWMKIKSFTFLMDSLSMVKCFAVATTPHCSVIEVSLIFSHVLVRMSQHIFRIYPFFPFITARCSLLNSYSASQWHESLWSYFLFLKKDFFCWLATLGWVKWEMTQL